MSEHDENDLSSRFQIDQAEARAEEESRETIIWAQRVRDAETTLDQREALTRLVTAKASLLATLDTLIWLAVAMAVVFGIVLGLIEVFA